MAQPAAGTPPAPSSEELAELLASLQAAVDPGIVDQVQELRRRTTEDRLRLLVVGEAKRGKSSLVNALLGLDLLPTGAVPVTTLATTIVHDSRTFAAIDYVDGRAERVPVSELARFVTEQENPANRLEVRAVTVHTDAPLLAAGVELVDTPGTGSIHEHNTTTALEAFSDMDTALLTVSADVPLTAADRRLLTQVADASVRVFCVLTKADHLSPAELDEVLQFVGDAVAQALGSRIRVYPCTVRAPDDPGLQLLREELDRYLAQSRSHDLRSSVVRHAGRLARAASDEVALSLGVLAEDESTATDLVKALTARLKNFGEDRLSADLIAVAGRGVLADLDTRAAAIDHELRAEADAVVATLMAGPLRDAAPRVIEAEGRSRALQLLLPALERWREQAQQIVTDGLVEAIGRVSRQGDEDVAQLQRYTYQQLGITLHVELAGIELPERRAFYYQLAPPPSQTEMTAATIRHLLPGRAGRARAVAHLQRDITTVVTSQAGRIRAHMQSRFAEAQRSLRNASWERRRDTAGRLQVAAAAAEDARRGTSAQATALRTRLSARQQLLRSVEDGLERFRAETR